MPKSEPFNPQVKTISRRKMLLLCIQAAGIIKIATRAKELQVDQSEKYTLMAENNRIDSRLEVAPRGIIHDRSGRKIADNIPNFQVVLSKQVSDDPGRVLSELAKIINLPTEYQTKLLETIASHKGYGLITIAEHLTWKQYVMVSENLPALKGCQTQIALSRIYPYHELFAHEVGYVGRVSSYDLERMENPNPIYHAPGMAIGKNGIEATLENELRGKEGRVEMEKNARGRVVRELGHVGALAGTEMQLTLDAEFQQYGATRFGTESGSVVIIDIETGDVKLMVSAPSFDPNKFVFGISQKEYNELQNNIRFPMYNKTVSGQYPPGSTFKMVTALAALEAGVVGAYDSVHCSGKMSRKGTRDFHCWKRSGHGTVNLRNSLKHSCDVYYYLNAEKAGITNISNMGKKLGLGQKYDIPLSVVRSGLLGNIEWKKEALNQDWVVGDTFSAGIGQGYIETTPLQLAVMTARIASGKAVYPNLIHSKDGKKIVQEFETLDINPEHLRLVRDGMYAVSNDNGGTAYATRIQGGQQWAGKTGTAQVRTISKAERERGVISNSDLEWALRDHALFVAFAPYDKPKYAISVIVEHGGGGSTTAAPIARDLMLYALYDGPPPLDAYPASGRAAAQNFMSQVPSLQDVVFTNTENRVEEPVDEARSNGTKPA